MKDYKDITVEEAKSLKGVMADIDDTLTVNGQLTLASYEALWKAHNAGLIVIPITGRPAGWCDMIARQWPVTGVVGENGAFYFYMKNNKMHKYYVYPEKQRVAWWKKLRKIKKKIFSEFPELKLASDQSYREADLAIDFKEDVPDQGLDVAKRVKEVFTGYKAQARISSIHVNCWFGDYDKLSTTKLFFDYVLGLDFNENANKFMFFGDSPNDSPMFSAIKCSCGIGNIEKYGNLMTSSPQFLSRNEDGNGVLDVINHILKLREG